MMNKVGSDFYITLKLENVEGLPVRANSVSDLKVKVFTSDINTFVEFSNITISDNEDRLYIDYDLLSDLKSGVICYTYSYKIDDTNFKDKYFNSININYTNFYLRQTTLVGKDADLSQNEILAICDRKLLDLYKELKKLIETSTPKIEIDKELKDSENPVSNKVINLKFSDIDNTITQIKNITPKITVDTLLSETSENPVANRVILRTFNLLYEKIDNTPTIMEFLELDNKINEIQSELFDFRPKFSFLDIVAGDVADIKKDIEDIKKQIIDLKNK